MARVRLRASVTVPDGGGSGSTYSNDVHRLDVRTLVWEELVATGTAQSPLLPRVFHSFVATRDWLYVFGGSSDTQASGFCAAPRNLFAC